MSPYIQAVPDAARRERIVELPEGSKTRTQYDEIGNVIKKIDGRENEITFQYDELSQLKKMNFPNGTYAEKDYYPDGMIKWEKDLKGNTTSYIYSSRNEVTPISMQNEINFNCGFHRCKGESRCAYVSRSMCKVHSYHNKSEGFTLRIKPMSKAHMTPRISQCAGRSQRSEKMCRHSRRLAVTTISDVMPMGRICRASSGFHPTSRRAR